MSQEEKSISLQDLCARLPYGVKCNALLKQIDGSSKSIFGTFKWYNGWATVGNNLVDIETVRPYLRPMSSMTRKELYEVQEILGKGVEIHDVFISIVDSSINTFSYLELQAVFNWLNSRHFDYCGLIEKGLALEAPEGMYNV